MSRDAAVGQVVWLFEEHQPYLAELFVDGLPSTRMQHLGRKSISDDIFVGRLLGAPRRVILRVSRNAFMMPFSDLCAPLPDAYLRCVSLYNGTGTTFIYNNGEVQGL